MGARHLTPWCIAQWNGLGGAGWPPSLLCWSTKSCHLLQWNGEVCFWAHGCTLCLLKCLQWVYILANASGRVLMTLRRHNLMHIHLWYMWVWLCIITHLSHPIWPHSWTALWQCTCAMTIYVRCDALWWHTGSLTIHIRWMDRLSSQKCVEHGWLDLYIQLNMIKHMDNISFLDQCHETMAHAAWLERVVLVMWGKHGANVLVSGEALILLP